MWHCVVGQVVLDVLTDHSAITLRFTQSKNLTLKGEALWFFAISCPTQPETQHHIAEDLDLANRASFQNIVLEETHDGEQCGNMGVVRTAVFIQLNGKHTAIFAIQQIYRGGDKSLARPDWKKQFKSCHFLSDTEVIAAAETRLDGQPSEFFLSGLQKSEFGHCSLFPSRSG